MSLGDCMPKVLQTCAVLFNVRSTWLIGRRVGVILLWDAEKCLTYRSNLSEQKLPEDLSSTLLPPSRGQVDQRAHELRL